LCINGWGEHCGDGQRGGGDECFGFCFHLVPFCGCCLGTPIRNDLIAADETLALIPIKLGSPRLNWRGTK
jgi:hypothetical protein